MSRQAESAELAGLRRRWRQWSAIVRLFAQHRTGRDRVKESEYRALHDALLESCRVQATRGDETRRSFFRQMEDMAKPWLTAHSLARADRAILLDLLARCQKVERALGGARWWLRRTTRVLVLLLVVALAGGLLLASWSASQAGLPGLERARGPLHQVWLAVKQSSFNQRLLVAGTVVTLFAGYMVWRSGRKY